jgi:hypothetical protein
MNKLLSRDEFRNKVFERDSFKCIMCGNPAKDAHHILERRLFPDEGYYIDNGASLCEQHHLDAEMTTLSTQEIREKLNIKEPILPPHLYRDNEYDKWGNIILPNGSRSKGELFFDESVQKILTVGNVLHLFTNYIKYPRTYHLPFSEGRTKDDKVLQNCEQFKNKRVIVTLKMDGENTTMYSDYIHARSLDSNNHPSRNWVKNIHGKIMGDIPTGWRICGENLYATHSIPYDNLESYFYIFSIWTNANVCLSWDDTIEWCHLLNLPHVPVLFDGIFDEKKIKDLINPTFNNEEMEGFVIRIADSFQYRKFKDSVGKFVRKNHVHTHGHWMKQKLTPNKLKDSK